MRYMAAKFVLPLSAICCEAFKTCETILLCGASTSSASQILRTISFICEGLRSHRTTPLKTSNKPPTPFSEMPTRKDSWRIDCGATFIRFSRGFALQRRQASGAAHQPQIFSVPVELVDIAHGNSVFILVDALNGVAGGDQAFFDH